MAAPGGPAPPPGGAPALPPGMSAAPPGAGPMAPQQGNPGNSLAALAKIKTALMLLQEALPAIPLGSDAHSDILKTVAMLAKHVPDAGQGGDQQQITQLQQLIQKLAQQQPNAALARIAQPAANAQPALPQPASPPADMPMAA